MAQGKFTENCMICGSELEYLEHPIMGTCLYCGAQELSYFRCCEGHFVCNKCHADDALVKITNYCLNSKSVDPLQMLEELMADPSVAMHGPEHHALVPAVLVTAFRNATGKGSDEDILEAIRRGSRIPGGYCGIYGACGAGVGTGVAVAVITGSTPLRAEPRALSNQMTAEALGAIGQHGGARCCKASSRLAVQTAVDFLQRHLACSLPVAKKLNCTYMKRNAQCNHKKCNYFPNKLAAVSK